MALILIPLTAIQSGMAALIHNQEHLFPIDLFTLEPGHRYEVTFS